MLACHSGRRQSLRLSGATRLCLSPPPRCVAPLRSSAVCPPPRAVCAEFLACPSRGGRADGLVSIPGGSAWDGRRRVVGSYQQPPAAQQLALSVSPSTQAAASQLAPEPGDLTNGDNAGRNAKSAKGGCERTSMGCGRAAMGSGRAAFVSAVCAEPTAAPLLKPKSHRGAFAREGSADSPKRGEPAREPRVALQQGQRRAEARREAGRGGVGTPRARGARRSDLGRKFGCRSRDSKP